MERELKKKEVASAYSMGFMCNNRNPATPEQLQELEKLKSQFPPEEAEEICIDASRSMDRLREAKRLIAKVRTSIIDNGATAEVADAFIEGFMSGEDVYIQ